MAITSNIDIAVEEAQFASFYAQFKKYRAELDQTPEAWRKVSRSAEVAQSKFQAVSDAAAAHAKTLDQAVESTVSFRRATDATAHAWKTIARDTALASRHIGDATTSLLKWAGVTSIVSGVLGLGGLTAFGVGIDLLGAGVSAQRTTSMGLGTSIGGLQAARTNFGRFGNVESMLSRMQQGKTDANFRIGLRNLGFSDPEIDNTSSDELLAKALPRVRKFAQEHQRGGALQNALESNKIPFSLEEAQTLAGSEPGEVEGLSQRFFKDKKDFEPAKGTAEKWQDFTTQMERAGRTISRVISDNLVNIEPGLNSLSDALADLAKTLLREDGPVAHWLEDFGHGIEWLAKKMEEPEFVQSMDHFVHWMGELASKTGQLAAGILSWMRWLGLAPAEDVHAGGSTGPGYTGKSSGTRTPPDRSPGTTTGEAYDRGGTPSSDGGEGTGSGLRGGGGSSPRSSTPMGRQAAEDSDGGKSTVARGTLASNQAEAYNAAKEEGLSDSAAKLLVANLSGESLRNPSDYHWDTKHYSQGIAQWDPERAEAIKQQFGKYPKDLPVSDQTKAAIWEMKTNPRFGESWNALNNEDMSNERRMGAVVRNYEAPGNVPRATGQRMDYFRGLRTPVSEIAAAPTQEAHGASLRDRLAGARSVHHGHHDGAWPSPEEADRIRGAGVAPRPLPENTMPAPVAKPSRERHTSFRNPMRDMGNHPRSGANKTQVVINRNIGGNAINTVNQLVRM